MRFSQLTHLLMCLSLETFVVELIDLVNSAVISQTTLLRWLTFLLISQTVILSSVPLDLFISSEASICCTMPFLPLGDSDHVVISVSIDFPSNSQQDVPFHCTAWLVLIGMVSVIRSDKWIGVGGNSPHFGDQKFCWGLFYQVVGTCWGGVKKQN